MGGGGGTDTVDEEYNAGMLELSQEEHGWASEAWNMFKYGTTYDPNEQVTGYYDESGNFVEGSQLVENPNYIPGHWETTWENGQQTSHWVESTGGDQYIPGAGDNYITTTRGELNQYNPDAVTSEMEYLQNIVDANQDLLGLQTDVSRGELQGQLDLQPYQTAANRSGLQLTTAQNEAATGLVGLQTDVTRAGLQSQLELNPYETEASRTGLQLTSAQNQSAMRVLPYSEQSTISGLQLSDTSNKYKTGFLNDLSAGRYDVDPVASMNEAQAGVQHGMKTARESADRNLQSFGLDPSSGMYASTNRGLALSEAAGIAGARTKAKNDAEQTTYSRRTGGLAI